MITVETKNNTCLLRFKGKKHQFNEYINKVMKLTDKTWCLDNKCWIIPRSSLPEVEYLFAKIEFLDEVSDFNRQKISDYEDMGKDMKLAPYPFQKEAIKYSIDNYETLLVYPCGSGKTPIGIGTYLEAKAANIITGPGMIIVKASLKVQWLKEIEKFSDLRAKIIQTDSEISTNAKNRIKTRKANIKKYVSEKDKIDKLRAEIAIIEESIKTEFSEQFNDCDLYILNYEALRDASIRSELHKKRIQFIFADEVHYVKSRTAKRSEALYEFGTAKMKIGATATPIGKDPEDIFGIFKFVAPNLFPSFQNFARLYVKYAGFGKVVGIKNKDHLMKKYAAHIIVKTKEEISSQLPSIVVIQRFCDMTQAQEATNSYIMTKLDDLKAKEKLIRMSIKTEVEAKNNKELQFLGMQILAYQTFAQELANTPLMLLESKSNIAKTIVEDTELEDMSSPKIDLLIELIDEIINSGEKVCIFSKYETSQTILTDIINKEFGKDVKIAYVSGKLDAKKRYEEVYTKFQNDDQYKILIMTDAGAEGLNLSKCKYIIELDLAVSFGMQTQRHGRIERSDSIHDNVFVYQLIVNDSWDVIQRKIIEKKEGYDTELIKYFATSEDNPNEERD